MTEDSGIAESSDDSEEAILTKMKCLAQDLEQKLSLDSNLVQEITQVCDNFGKLGKECTTYFKGELDKNWQYGKTFGNIYIGANKVEHYFPSWKPGFWKSFCATGSKRYF